MLLAATALLILPACSDGGDDEARATTTTAVAATTTEAPTFSGDPDSEFCRALRDVDLADPEVPDGSPESVRANLDHLLDTFRLLRTVAPEEIAADVTLVADGVVALDDALSQVEYDFDALAASGQADELLEATNDPAYAEAGARLTAYRTQVCELS